MKTYRVGFYKVDERGREMHLGSNTVDTFPWDKIPMQTKAFRQATPNQQVATILRVESVKPWGAPLESMRKEEPRGQRNPNHRKR